MEKRIYFLSPLEAEWYERGNNTDNPDEVLGGAGLLEFQEEIQKKIEEIKRITGADLMEYYDGDDSVKAKVKSLEPVVTVYGGELKGCAVVRVKEPLNQKEMEDLKKYLTGQYSDGWGEGFEQQDIPVEDGVLNVHFWNSDYFRMDILHKIPEQIKPECAVKPKLKLLGHDGNVFSILGDASRLLKQNGQPEAAKEMFDRVTSSQSYEQALAIISEYVETELSRDMDQPKPEKQGKKKTERER